MWAIRATRLAWAARLLSATRLLSTTRRPPHVVLGIAPGARVAEIKLAYYRLALAYHPDTSRGQAQEDTARRFAEVGDAYRAMLAQQAAPVKQTLTVETLRDLRDQVDERIVGAAALRSSRRFFADTFYKLVGENFDVVIFRHIEQRDLMSALETFRLMQLMNKQPTRSTFEMLIRGCTMSMTPTRDYDEADHLTQSLWLTVEELFTRMESEFKLKPDTWTLHEMIRASGKAGRFDDARYYFDLMCENAFTLPPRPVYNSMLEACIRTGNHAHCFNVMEEMNEIRQAVWFKYKFRADAVTVGLLLKASVEGSLLEKLPRVLQLMGKDGLYPDRATSNRLLDECVRAGKLDTANELLLLFRRRGVAISAESERALLEASTAAPSKDP